MTPAKQLEAFIAKFTPAIAKVVRAVLPKMRRRFRGTHELVYDNYNALAIGWSPTGRTSDVICSIAVFPRWVSLFFFRAPKLADPARRLKGKGSTTRHIVLEDGAKTLDEPEVADLLTRAIAASPAAPTGKGAPKLEIRSISAKQRPRRPA